MRDAWRRAQAWAPEFVAEDLRAARELAEEYRRDAVIWRAGLDRHPVGSPERELAERDVAAAEQLATVSAARVDALERIQAVRTDWLDRNRELQERAAFAGDELERRGLDRDTAAPVGEQQELFTIADPSPTPSPTRPTRATTAAGVRDLDPAQHQLDLDERAPRRSRCRIDRARGHRAHDVEHHRQHRRPSVRATADDAQRRPPQATRGAARPRRRSSRTPRRRTAMPSCSPRPNVRPTASASSPLCSRRDPSRPTSPPRSRCTSTTPLAASGRRRRRAHRRRVHHRGLHAHRLAGIPTGPDHRRAARRTRRPRGRRGAYPAPRARRRRDDDETSTSGQPATTTSSPAPTSRRARVSSHLTRRVPARSAVALLFGAHGSDRTGPTCHPCHGETPAVFCGVQLRAARGGGRGQPLPRPVSRGVVDRCRGKGRSRAGSGEPQIVDGRGAGRAGGAVRAPPRHRPLRPTRQSPTARLLGGSRIDYDVDTFDPCSPFRSTLWLKTAVVDRQLAPQAAPEPGAAAGGGVRG